jgi:hypothetical protein
MNLRIILPQTGWDSSLVGILRASNPAFGSGAGHVFSCLDDSLLAAGSGKDNRLRTVSRIVGNRDGAGQSAGCSGLKSYTDYAVRRRRESRTTGGAIRCIVSARRYACDIEWHGARVSQRNRLGRAGSGHNLGRKRKSRRGQSDRRRPPAKS